MATFNCYQTSCYQFGHSLYLNSGVLVLCPSTSGKIRDLSLAGVACGFKWISRLGTYRDGTAVGNVTNVVCIGTRSDRYPVFTKVW